MTLSLREAVKSGEALLSGRVPIAPSTTIRVYAHDENPDVGEPPLFEYTVSGELADGTAPYGGFEFSTIEFSPLEAYLKSLGVATDDGWIAVEPKP